MRSLYSWYGNGLLGIRERATQLRVKWYTCFKLLSFFLPVSRERYMRVYISPLA